jgi:tetratricopeptide (TPR) repeat protein
MTKKFFFLLILSFFSFSISLLLGLIQNAETVKNLLSLNPDKNQQDQASENLKNGRYKNSGTDIGSDSSNDLTEIKRKSETYFLYGSAIINIQKGDLDRAQETIEKLLKNNPDNSQFHLVAAQLFLEKKDTQRAKKEVESVLKQNESDFEAWRLLGMINLDLFRKDEKQEYLDKVLSSFKNVFKYHPEDIDEVTLRITSLLLLEEGKNDEAIVYLQRLLQHYPSHPVAVQNLEKIYYEKKDFRSLLDLYKQLAEETPEDLTTQFKLADVAFKLKNYDDAEKALTYLDEEISKAEDAKINKDNWAVMLKQLGYILARENRLDEALDKLLKSRMIKDDFFTTYYIILVLMQRKEYDTARRELNIALKEYANNKEADDLKILNCQLLQKENKNNEALNEIDKLINADKTNIEYKTAKARLLMGMYEFQDAKDYLQELYKQYPSDTDIIFQLGCVFERLKEFSEGEKFLKLCLKLEPQNSAAMNYLGYMWADQGINLQEAENLIKKALELDPTSSAYLDSLGWVYFKMGNYAKARFFLEKAIKAGVEGGEIYDHLGDLYYKINFIEEAIESWKKILKEDDPNIDYEKIQDKIKTAEDKFKK